MFIFVIIFRLVFVLIFSLIVIPCYINPILRFGSGVVVRVIMVILWCVCVRFIFMHSCVLSQYCILVHSCILCILVHSYNILLSCVPVGTPCGISCHSCGSLCHLSVRGWFKVCGVVIVVVVALITVLAVILVGWSVGRISGVIIGPFHSLEERAPVSVFNVKSPGIAACKTVHTVDDVLWEGEGSGDLAIKSPAGREAHEEV